MKKRIFFFLFIYSTKKEKTFNPIYLQLTIIFIIIVIIFTIIKNNVLFIIWFWIRWCLLSFLIYENAKSFFVVDLGNWDIAVS